MSDNHESMQELLQYRKAFTCQIEYWTASSPKSRNVREMVSTNYASPKWDGLAVQRIECPCRLSTLAAYVLWEPFWIGKQVIFGKVMITCNCSIYIIHHNIGSIQRNACGASGKFSYGIQCVWWQSNKGKRRSTCRHVLNFRWKWDGTDCR